MTRLFRFCLPLLLVGLAGCSDPNEVKVKKEYGYLTLDGKPLVVVPAQCAVRGQVEYRGGKYRIFLNEVNDPGFHLCIEIDAPLEDLKKPDAPGHVKFTGEAQGYMSSSKIPGPAPGPGPAKP